MAIITTPLLLSLIPLLANRGLAVEASILVHHREAAPPNDTHHICYHPETHLCIMNHLENAIVALIRLRQLMLGPTIPILVRSMSNSLLPLTHHQIEAIPLNTPRARANQWQ